MKWKADIVVFGSRQHNNSKRSKVRKYAPAHDECVIALIACRAFLDLPDAGLGYAAARPILSSPKGRWLAAFIMKRIQAGDYNTWKPMLRSGGLWRPKISQGATDLRSVEDPNEVFIQIEFASSDDARVARERLLASKVMDRSRDKSGPTVVEEAED